MSQYDRADLIDLIKLTAKIGLNLGLNNLKFDQEAISDWIDSIGSTQLDRIELTTNMTKFNC